jgi:hypothetical protein
MIGGKGWGGKVWVVWWKHNIPRAMSSRLISSFWDADADAAIFCISLIYHQPLHHRYHHAQCCSIQGTINSTDNARHLCAPLHSIASLQSPSSTIHPSRLLLLLDQTVIKDLENQYPIGNDDDHHNDNNDMVWWCYSGWCRSCVAQHQSLHQQHSRRCRSKRKD